LSGSGVATGSPASIGGGPHVRVRGLVGDEEREHARTVVGAVLADHGVPASAARVRLSGGNCGGGPLLVQANLRVCGAPARIQVPGRSPAAAIDAAADRLRRQLRRLTTAWEPWPWPDPQRRALAAPGRGRIARGKSYRLNVGAPCQAAAVLNAMDYDVYLFTDAETGQDAVVYRSGPTGLRLARQRSMRPPSMPAALPLTVNSRKVPTLTAAHAADRLAEGWLPFVFFTEAHTGRGNLLYRRYDGNLGLITPVGSTAPVA
jgi:hypothetical protein